MTVTVSAELTGFIEQQVASGRFGTADAVVDAGLRLLAGRDELLRDVQAGLADADAGRVGPLDPAATLARVRAGRTAAEGG